MMFRLMHIPAFRIVAWQAWHHNVWRLACMMSNINFNSKGANINCSLEIADVNRFPCTWEVLSRYMLRKAGCRLCTGRNLENMHMWLPSSLGTQNRRHRPKLLAAVSFHLQPHSNTRNFFSVFFYSPPREHFCWLSSLTESFHFLTLEPYNKKALIDMKLFSQLLVLGLAADLIVASTWFSKAGKFSQIFCPCSSSHLAGFTLWPGPDYLLHGNVKLWASLLLSSSSWDSLSELAYRV